MGGTPGSGGHDWCDYEHGENTNKQKRNTKNTFLCLRARPFRRRASPQACQTRAIQTFSVVKYLSQSADEVTFALIFFLCVSMPFSVFPRLNGTRGGYCGAHSRGCYSDVRDARLCREFVKEEQGGGGSLTTKGFRGRES